jgi:hypothetical protein
MVPASLRLASLCPSFALPIAICHLPLCTGHALVALAHRWNGWWCWPRFPFPSSSPRGVGSSINSSAHTHHIHITLIHAYIQYMHAYIHTKRTLTNKQTYMHAHGNFTFVCTCMLSSMHTSTHITYIHMYTKTHKNKHAFTHARAYFLHPITMISHALLLFIRHHHLLLLSPPPPPPPPFHFCSASFALRCSGINTVSRRHWW